MGLTDSRWLTIPFQYKRSGLLSALQSFQVRQPETYRVHKQDPGPTIGC